MSFAVDDSKKDRDQNVKDDIFEAFHKFDTDRDGFLRPVDLRRILDRLGVTLTDTELSDMVREADINKDGLIDFEEFTKIMMKEDPTNVDLEDSTTTLAKGTKGKT